MSQQDTIKDIHKIKEPYIYNPKLLSDELTSSHSDVIRRLLDADFNAKYTTTFTVEDYSNISKIADAIRTIEPNKYKMSPEMQSFLVKYVVRNRATYVRMYLMLRKLQEKSKITLDAMSQKMTANPELEAAKVAIIEGLSSEPNAQKKVKAIFAAQQSDFKQLGNLIAELQKNNNSLFHFVHKVIPTVTNWLDSSSDPA